MYNQFLGYNSETMTFEHRTKLDLNGKPITLTGNDGISPCNEGDVIFGVVSSQSRSYVSAQISGYVELPFTGDGLSVGYVKIAADGKGGIKASESGKGVWVVKTDAENHIAGFLL